MNCAGKMIVEFFSTDISAMVCNVRSCDTVLVLSQYPDRGEQIEQDYQNDNERHRVLPTGCIIPTMTQTTALSGRKVRPTQCQAQ
jgi:hypothetical protein